MLDVKLLRDNLPRVMELTDTFGNVTTLVFAGFERNPVLDAATQASEAQTQTQASVKAKLESTK